MSELLSQEERVVLQALESAAVLTLEDLTGQFPELSWSQLFHTVDTLSRRGAIELRRRGFPTDFQNLARVRRRVARVSRLHHSGRRPLEQSAHDGALS